MSYDALVSPRPYRPGMSKSVARAYILDQSGKHFDPDIAAEFVRMLDTSHTGDLSGPR